MNFNFELSQIAFDFLESSKSHSYGQEEFNARINYLNSSEEFHTAIEENTSELGYTKNYPLNFDSQTAFARQLREIQEKRESKRKFDPTGLTFKNLSSLLNSSYFIHKNNQGEKKVNLPSGGGIYPLDLFVLNINTNGIPAGIYFYNYRDCHLQTIKEFEISELETILKKAFGFRSDIDFLSASAVLLIGSMCNKTTYKYGDRGLRFVFLEAGTLLQSIYLTSSALGIAACANGGYLDDYLCNLVNYRLSSHSILSTIVIGKNLE